MHTIPAHVLDSALADISDVPVVEVEDGTLKVTFSGNYEPPVNDLVDFLAALERANPEAGRAARDGLYWEDGFYGGYAEAHLNGLALEPSAMSAYQPCTDCGDKREGDGPRCDYCEGEHQQALREPMDMSGGSNGSEDR